MEYHINLDLFAARNFYHNDQHQRDKRCVWLVELVELEAKQWRQRRKNNEPNETANQFRDQQRRPLGLPYRRKRANESLCVLGCF